MIFIWGLLVIGDAVGALTSHTLGKFEVGAQYDVHNWTGDLIACFPGVCMPAHD